MKLSSGGRANIFSLLTSLSLTFSPLSTTHDPLCFLSESCQLSFPQSSASIRSAFD